MIKLVWATPEIDRLIAYQARVSNPANQDNPNTVGIIKYMLENGHVSPFEMANACFEINTTRDIGRQILRHRSFSFQEFSQRYQSVDKLEEVPLRECRTQDTKNRQSSHSTDNEDLRLRWLDIQRQVIDTAQGHYEEALELGVAKEQARALLPEGLTPTRMYMNGTIRSWVFYLKSRLDPSTQKEHRLLAEEIAARLREIAPQTMQASGL